MKKRLLAGACLGLLWAQAGMAGGYDECCRYTQVLQEAEQVKGMSAQNWQNMAESMAEAVLEALPENVREQGLFIGTSRKGLGAPVAQFQEHLINAFRAKGIPVFSEASAHRAVVSSSVEPSLLKAKVEEGRSQAELQVTVSVVQEGLYVARKTNLFYVDSVDAAFIASMFGKTIFIESAK
jgi:hypothetical protein